MGAPRGKALPQESYLRPLAEVVVDEDWRLSKAVNRVDRVGRWATSFPRRAAEVTARRAAGGLPTSSPCLYLAVSNGHIARVRHVFSPAEKR
jgi:hypothetical protein